MRRAGRFFVAAILLALVRLGPDSAVAAAPVNACGANPNLVSIYIAPFTGDAMLSPRVRSIIALQILAGMRSADPEVPGSDFGAGCVERDSSAAPQVSILKLSGGVTSLRNDAVLTATLEAVRKNDRRPNPKEKWTVSIGDQHITYNIIADRYVFTVGSIKADALKNYGVLARTRFCLKPVVPCNDGFLNFDSIVALDAIPDFAHVLLGGRRLGWLYLPGISDEVDTLDFTAGVICVMRGDYVCSDRLMKRVAESSADNGVRVSAFLLLAATKQMRGEDGASFLEKAKDINPTLKSVFQTEIMMGLQSLSGDADAARRRDLAGRLSQEVEAAAVLFAADDPWLAAARSVLAAGR